MAINCGLGACIRIVLASLAFLLASSCLATTEFLLWPSEEDITALATLFDETSVPVPVPFVYDYQIRQLLAIGIPISKKVRNGVHGRLMVVSGMAADLKEVQFSSPKIKAGTLFIDYYNGKSYLAFHHRNSIRSTMHTDDKTTSQGVSVPKLVLDQIVALTQTPIMMAQPILQTRIDEENLRRYQVKFGSEGQNAVAQGKKQTIDTIDLKEVYVKPELSSNLFIDQPGKVARIQNLWLKPSCASSVSN